MDIIKKSNIFVAKELHYLTMFLNNKFLKVVNDSDNNQYINNVSFTIRFFVLDIA